MQRREFLALASGAATLGSLPVPAWAGSEHRRGLQLSCVWGMLGNVSVPEGLALLARHGYDAFEMFNWRDASLLDTFTQEMKKYSLACACLVANKGVEAPGCGLVNPSDRDGFLSEMALAIEAARKVNSKRLLVLTGNELGGLPRSHQMANAVAALKEVAPLLEKNGLTAIVEILNTYVDHAGYFLYYVRDAVQLVERVASPSVKLLLDIYHTQIMEGNLINNIRQYINHIDHFHVGDVPGRHEPGTGEINYRNVFKAIYEQGDRYHGYVALEYSPVAPLEENLAAMRELTTFG